MALCWQLPRLVTVSAPSAAAAAATAVLLLLLQRSIGQVLNMPNAHSSGCDKDHDRDLLLKQVQRAVPYTACCIPWYVQTATTHQKGSVPQQGHTRAQTRTVRCRGHLKAHWRSDQCTQRCWLLDSVIWPAGNTDTSTARQCPTAPCTWR